MKHELKLKLKEQLKREPTESETINAEQDINLIVKVLIDEIELLKAKVNTLEKRKNVL